MEISSRHIKSELFRKKSVDMASRLTGDSTEISLKNTHSGQQACGDAPKSAEKCKLKYTELLLAPVKMANVKKKEDMNNRGGRVG